MLWSNFGGLCFSQVPIFNKSYVTHFKSEPFCYVTGAAPRADVDYGRRVAGPGRGTDRRHQTRHISSTTAITGEGGALTLQYKVVMHHGIFKKSAVNFRGNKKYSLYGLHLLTFHQVML